MNSAPFRPPARLILVTAVLLAFTGLAAWLSRTSMPLPITLPTIALVFAWIKGFLVAEQFMELRHAPWTLRLLVQGWLAIVCAGLLLSLSA